MCIKKNHVHPIEQEVCHYHAPKEHKEHDSKGKEDGKGKEDPREVDLMKMWEEDFKVGEEEEKGHHLEEEKGFVKKCHMKKMCPSGYAMDPLHLICKQILGTPPLIKEHCKHVREEREREICWVGCV